MRWSSSPVQRYHWSRRMKNKKLTLICPFVDRLIERRSMDFRSHLTTANTTFNWIALRTEMILVSLRSFLDHGWSSTHHLVQLQDKSLHIPSSSSVRDVSAVAKDFLSIKVRRRSLNDDRRSTTIEDWRNTLKVYWLAAFIQLDQ